MLRLINYHNFITLQGAAHSLSILKLSYEPKDRIIPLKQKYKDPIQSIQILDYVSGGDLFSETLQPKQIPEEEARNV